MNPTANKIPPKIIEIFAFPLSVINPPRIVGIGAIAALIVNASITSGILHPFDTLRGFAKTLKEYSEPAHSKIAIEAIKTVHLVFLFI